MTLPFHSPPPSPKHTHAAITKESSLSLQRSSPSYIPVSHWSPLSSQPPRFPESISLLARGFQSVCPIAQGQALTGDLDNLSFSFLCISSSKIPDWTLPYAGTTGVSVLYLCSFLTPPNTSSLLFWPGRVIWAPIWKLLPVQSRKMSSSKVRAL